MKIDSSEIEIRICNAFKNGIAVKEIEKLENIGHTTIYKILRKNKLTKQYNRPPTIVGEEDIKSCTKCFNSYNIMKGFSKDASVPGGFRCWCKECDKTAHRKLKEREPLRIKKEQDLRAREHSLKKLGISQKIYDEMFYNQKGLCAICNKPETSEIKGKIKRLAVDHNHETGKVRGLL